jgi:hypothetical protein
MFRITRLPFRVCLWSLILILLPCCIWASRGNNDTIYDDEDWSIVNENIALSSKQMQRKLLALCEDGSTPVIHYFEVIVRIRPNATVTGICTLADQMKLGSDINKILSSHVSCNNRILCRLILIVHDKSNVIYQAIGDVGNYQTVKFKAAVCTLPTQFTRRSLQLATFLWKGGGGCRGCPCDCSDGRRDLQFAVWGTTEWFDTIYAPQLESSLLNNLLTKVVPSHRKCLGTGPVVTVEVNKVSLLQLISRFQCQAGRLTSLLETMSLSSIAVIDRMCSNCVTIDFSQASDKTALVGGMDISQQWQRDGLTIKTTAFESFFLPTEFLTFFPSTDFSSFYPSTAKIFDTSNLMCIQIMSAQEFGSPNQSCPGGGGIGWGFGGAVGTEGENCSPLGSKSSVLINCRISTLSSSYHQRIISNSYQINRCSHHTASHVFAYVSNA